MILRAMTPVLDLDVGLWYPSQRMRMPRAELKDAHVLLIPGDAPWMRSRDLWRTLVDGGARSVVIWGPDAEEWRDELEWVQERWETPESQWMACVAVGEETMEQAIELYATMAAYGGAGGIRSGLVLNLAGEPDPAELAARLRRAKPSLC